jgi:hypothetical protein
VDGLKLVINANLRNLAVAARIGNEECSGKRIIMNTLYLNVYFLLKSISLSEEKGALTTATSSWSETP